ncbi:MAG: glycosyltransferase family A protein [Thermoanaerobaculia bacterium]
MPNVSVVLPVYNGEASLEETLQSIFAQSEGDFELIAIDDGSTDGTRALLEDHARRDPRVRVLVQENAGITRALLRGCQAATAAVIARHDCGDVSHPDRLRRQLDILDMRPDVALVSCSAVIRGPAKERLYVVKGDGDNVRHSLLHDDASTILGLPHHGSAMFRREAYEAAGGYRAEFYFGQDIDLWIRIAALGGVHILPESLYEATLNVSAISATYRKEQVTMLSIATNLRDSHDPRWLDEAAAVRPSKTGRSAADEARALYFIASCLKREGNPAWRRYATQAVTRWPLLLRAWTLFVRPRP